MRDTCIVLHNSNIRYVRNTYEDREEKELNTNYLDNNHLVLVGKITSEKRFSHEIYGESFYIFDLEVPRLSETFDVIPITISERLINDDELQIGKKIVVKGQFRSYNS